MRGLLPLFVCGWYLITIRVFIQCKILSVETILSTYIRAHMHTQAPAHTSILTVQN